MKSKKLAPHQIRILELLGTEKKCVAYGDFGESVWPDPLNKKMRTGMHRQGLGMKASVEISKLRTLGYIRWLGSCQEYHDYFKVTAAGLEALQEVKQNG